MVKGPGNRLPEPSTSNHLSSPFLTIKERSGSRVEPSRSYKSPQASGIRMAKVRRAKGETDGGRKVEVRSVPSPTYSRAMSAAGRPGQEFVPSPFAFRASDRSSYYGRRV